MSSPEDEKLNEFVDALCDVMAYVLEESVLLARLEKFFSPQPAQLTDTKDIQRRVDRLVEHLGGPPRLIIKAHDEPPHMYDTYPAAAIDEMISMLHRARKSVCRAHMFMIGSQTVGQHPEWLNLPDDQEVRDAFFSVTEQAFWEYAEIGFIRLCSYWDRVGQILDFAFFGIRQFERDGFTAVMDRIHANIIPMRHELRNSIVWTTLRKYQNSEKEDGLKWLLRRRNLLIHSLYLRPIKSESEEDIFRSAYNHLDEKLRSKLAPRSPREEISQLHVHLGQAVELFPNVLSLLEATEDRS